MTRRQGIVAAVIVVAVVLMAIWSKLRFTDREGYNSPQRWKLDEHPVFQQHR